jgi:glutathione synthase/RimK-type ligase-like ATP-grasp enzyme
MISNILIITNKFDITSDFIIKALKARKIQFYRFNTDELGKTVYTNLNFDTNSFLLHDTYFNNWYDLKKFTAVYYRRPELPDTPTTQLTPGERDFINNENAFTLEGIYKILDTAYWVSPLYAIREAENKIHQLLVAQSIGLSIPSSVITNSFENAHKFFRSKLSDCIIKPIKTGLIEEANGSSVVFTSQLSDFPTDREQIELCPVFLQSKISKKTDVRVTVVGNKIFATLIHSQVHEETEVDWRKGENVLEHEVIELPEDLEQKCITLLKRLRLRYAAIDLIQDSDGAFIFLEINPNGQWAWIEKQTGQEISSEIVNLLLHENF